MPSLKNIVVLLALCSAAWTTQCRPAALTPGDYRFELSHDGRQRHYYVHLPPQAANAALPVLLSLHGGGGNARQHRRDTGMDAAADRDGYIAVYPDGSGRLPETLLTWNAGNCCAYAQWQHIDDVGFIAAVLDDLQLRVPLDPHRIYASGHSNGGMMAHRLGEVLAQRFAAIASVAGAHIPAEHVGRAVPVLQIHSIDDPRALYYGGLGPPFPLTGTRVLHPSVEATLTAWIDKNGCDGTALQQAYRQSDRQTATLQLYDHCRNGAKVALWQLSGSGHGWPGAMNNRETLVGPSTKIIDANTEIWRFVSQFSLNP
jgi:polyhydroxybutyrate depolymerase